MLFTHKGRTAASGGLRPACLTGATADTSLSKNQLPPCPGTLIRDLWEGPAPAGYHTDRAADLALLAGRTRGSIDV